jgi:hypothetical protein
MNYQPSEKHSSISENQLEGALESCLSGQDLASIVSEAIFLSPTVYEALLRDNSRKEFVICDDQLNSTDFFHVKVSESIVHMEILNWQNESSVFDCHIHQFSRNNRMMFGPILPISI